MKNINNLSEFDNLYHKWNHYFENNDKSNKIATLLENNELILFFKFEDKVFGCPEESRLLFAKMKNKDKDISKDCSFMAYNLQKAMLGQEVIQLFKNKDLAKIKVLSKQEVENILKKYPMADETIKFNQEDDEYLNDKQS